MATGDLTRYFGEELVVLLAGKLEDAWPAFDGPAFRGVAPDLDDLTLMKRVDRIAAALGPCLPPSQSDAWDVMARVLPPPLSEGGQVFGDGYWMLPLAAYWPMFWCPSAAQTADPATRDAARHELAVSLTALGELTQRGTSEFGIRRFASEHPDVVLDRITAWREHGSFHVRRLCSEGARPYLPWAGKLKVSREEQAAYLHAVTPLANDSSAYVRRSVGNHVRDWRRIDPAVADRWIEETDPPPDVRKLASPRKPKQ